MRIASVVSRIAAVYVEVIPKHADSRPDLHGVLLLPQVGIRLDAFTAAWVAVTIWGGAFNTENFRAGFEAVPRRATERPGLRARIRLARHVPQRDLPHRRRDRASLVDQHVHLSRQEHLADVRDRLRRTATAAINIANLSLETLEALTVLAIVYLTLVWSLSAAIRVLENRLALPEAR